MRRIMRKHRRDIPKNNWPRKRLGHEGSGKLEELLQTGGKKRCLKIHKTECNPGLEIFFWSRCQKLQSVSKVANNIVLMLISSFW